MVEEDERVWLEWTVPYTLAPLIVKSLRGERNLPWRDVTLLLILLPPLPLLQPLPLALMPMLLASDRRMIMKRWPWMSNCRKSGFLTVIWRAWWCLLQLRGRIERREVRRGNSIRPLTSPVDASSAVKVESSGFHYLNHVIFHRYKMSSLLTPVKPWMPFSISQLHQPWKYPVMSSK